MAAHIHAENEWLASLVAGDKVAIRRRHNAAPSILTVTKVTPTQIVCGQRRYRKDTGRVIGSDSWNSHFLKQATKGIRDEAEVAILAESFSLRDWSAIELQTLRAIAALLSEPQP